MIFGSSHRMFLILFPSVFGLYLCKSMEFAILEEAHTETHFNYQKDSILDQFRTSADTVVKTDTINANKHKILGTFFMSCLQDSLPDTGQGSRL